VFSQALSRPRGKTPEVYSSWENTALIRFTEGMPRESIEMQRYILLNIDPPEHTKLRGIVSRGFAPRAIGNLRQVLTERAERIVATALESGTGDFVADVASELPLHPEQWELFKTGRPETAADEIVRWATPITVFQRTAVTDTTLGGQEIKAGQRVGLFYRSANFDEEVFDEPEKFDVLRNPNPHLGFGGLGTHYCLGASLAKLEIELIFNAIADAMPDIAKAGDPVRLRSGWINGIKRLTVTYRP
jgi:cytochrome P450